MWFRLRSPQVHVFRYEQSRRHVQQVNLITRGSSNMSKASDYIEAIRAAQLIKPVDFTVKGSTPLATVKEDGTLWITEAIPPELIPAFNDWIKENFL